MTYTQSYGVRIIQCAPSEFHIVLYDCAKKSIPLQSYANANFFAANQRFNGYTFTLPINHLICDYKVSNAGADTINRQRGKFVGSKYCYDSYNYGAPGDQFYKKPLTTLIIENGAARITDVANLQTHWDYAIAGIPIMKQGKDVIWKTYVKSQGWTGGELYATYHIFVGLKQNDSSIYLMEWKSSTSNMISSGEAYKKFKSLGFYDVIKLDGGGSEILKYQGTTLHSTSENRRISAVIELKSANTPSAPVPSTTSNYQMPTRAIQRYMKGDDVKWVQQKLNEAGFNCGQIDGIFGNQCYIATKTFQKSHKLAIDGSVGPQTRAVLAKY